MVLHGCYVFAHVAWMWRRWSEEPPPEAPVRAQSAEMAFRRACEVLAGIDLIVRHARLTARGRALASEITACATEQKDAVAVSAAWRQRVNEELAAHRQRHLKTSQCSDPITF
jgi:cytochrome P450